MGVIKGDTRSLDNGSHSPTISTRLTFLDQEVTKLDEALVSGGSSGPMQMRPLQPFVCGTFPAGCIEGLGCRATGGLRLRGVGFGA